MTRLFPVVSAMALLLTSLPAQETPDEPHPTMPARLVYSDGTPAAGVSFIMDNLQRSPMEGTSGPDGFFGIIPAYTEEEGLGTTGFDPAYLRELDRLGGYIDHTAPDPPSREPFHSIRRSSLLAYGAQMDGETVTYRLPFKRGDLECQVLARHGEGNAALARSEFHFSAEHPPLSIGGTHVNGEWHAPTLRFPSFHLECAVTTDNEGQFLIEDFPVPNEGSGMIMTLTHAEPLAWMQHNSGMQFGALRGTGPRFHLIETPGFAPAHQTFVFRLPEPITFAGQVVDSETGDPLPDFTFHLWETPEEQRQAYRQSRNIPREHQFLQEVTTDSTGHFAVERFPAYAPLRQHPSSLMRLGASEPDYKPVTAALLLQNTPHVWNDSGRAMCTVNLSDTNSSEVTLRVTEHPALRVVAVDAENNPLPHIPLEVITVGEGGQIRRGDHIGFTDDQGVLMTVQPKVDGSFYIRGWHRISDLVLSESILSPETNQTITVRAIRVIPEVAIRVISEDSTPMRGLSPTTTHYPYPDHREIYYRCGHSSNHRGLIELRNLLATPTKIEVSDHDGRSAEVNLDLNDTLLSEPITLELSALSEPAPCLISGTVSDVFGNPISGTHVFTDYEWIATDEIQPGDVIIRDRMRLLQQTQTNAEGGYEIEVTPWGPYRRREIHFHHDGYFPLKADYPSGASGEIHAALSPAITLEGTIEELGGHGDSPQQHWLEFGLGFRHGEDIRVNDDGTFTKRTRHWPPIIRRQPDSIEWVSPEPIEVPLGIDQRWARGLRTTVHVSNEPGQRIDFGEIELMDMPALRVRAVNQDGHPLVGVQISEGLFGPGFEWYPVEPSRRMPAWVTGPDGRSGPLRLVDGEHTLTLSLQGYENRQVTIHYPEETEVTVTLPSLE